MSIKNSTTKSDYINFDTATNKANDLLKTKHKVYGLYIIVSINTGLRISDVLNLTWEQLREEKITITETKTKKVRTIQLNDNIKKAVAKLDTGRTGLAFLSQKRTVLSKQRINIKLKEIFKRECKNCNISSHSLRKTFGRRVYENNNESEKALLYLSELFSHSSLAYTRIYLGIRQEELDDIYLNL